MTSVQRPIAVTLGDPAGIGPEIIVKAFRDATGLMEGCFVAGDVRAVRRAAQALAAPGVLALPVAVIEMATEAIGVPSGCIPVLQAVEPADGTIAVGAISAVAGRMAGDCVVWAARAALRGEVAAIVTAPLHKEALSAAGFTFPGHTELLQAEAAAHLGRPVAEVPVRMMLANDELRTVLVSIHMSLRDAIEAVTFDGVLETLRITHSALTAVLGRAPKIGVAGLNPHAGEGGLFGSEERDIIVPAISAAQAEGIDADGPHAPDTIFMRARAKAHGAIAFDVVIAMYHDQGLIPVKYLGVEKGVNVTLGLPLVRTSPDHGTAFDIAGTGRADPSSLIEAVRMAKSLSGVVRGA
ncbi:4-hydroxythreonine-4-phosphate dehydrogenase PdxA [Variovorax sp. J22R115]|uniref:4-hydroxythreonine-4-phosphate dehydrogenase PdxA n=1 Tax=Variovorax sp. J22R115 TaxID=3053509 RepID=UPI0025780AC1|nr:4-hydroxythreonine-4-phosphate dehydrogenase PdxA [Variovorax sp. J22R115]MDM0051874.1 4-hydroxythreonine-4-phosphate dehydrogenase PdxA [Variovorax sp. J22R115]